MRTLPLSEGPRSLHPKRAKSIRSYRTNSTSAHRAADPKLKSKRTLCVLEVRHFDRVTPGIEVNPGRGRKRRVESIDVNQLLIVDRG